MKVVNLEIDHGSLLLELVQRASRPNKKSLTSHHTICCVFASRFGSVPSPGVTSSRKGKTEI